MHLSDNIWPMGTKQTDAAVSAWTRLIRASRTVLSAVEADLKSAGFPPLAWYDALLELDRAKGGPLRPFELEERLLLAQYNLSRLVDRLSQAGYVEKLPCADDRRGHVLSITPQGRALLRKMWPVYRAAIKRHIGSHLGNQQAFELAGLLAKLVPGKADA